ncbi:MAG: sn-glycerol-3-phosphate ABC transporter ATP-binding protein UgpC [Pseudomonadota bacterium]
MASVSLAHIGKHYDGHPVLHGIDLEIADGELMVFVGPSGCGKSTLLRMIAGLEAISAGQLHIGGRLANDIAPGARELAMVFQSYALYPHMTVFENMAFSLELAGHDKQQVREAVQRAADILQIADLLQRKPKELSGGQRQRVAIGRAIVRKPRLFLFDEPLSNLDASLRVQMRVEISRLHQALGTTMIYVTHDQVEAMTLGQRIAVFNDGRIAQCGTPHELYNRPANLFVAGFLGTPKMNFIGATVVQAGPTRIAVRLPGGAVIEVAADGTLARVGDALTLGLRAEHITAHPADDGQPNLVEAVVGHVEYLGDLSIVYAKVDGVAEMVAFKAAAGTVESAVLVAGGRLRLHMPARYCLLFRADGMAYARAAVAV